VPNDLEAIWAGNRQAIRLAMGELSAQEMRTVLALLNLLRPEYERLKHKLQEYEQHKLQEYGLELISLHDQLLLAQMDYLKQQGRSNDVSRAGREGGAVGYGPEDYSQQQSNRAADEDDVGAGRAS
jgi:hypothetical protein